MQPSGLGRGSHSNSPLRLKAVGFDDESEPFLWGDAIALGAFAVIGTQNGIRARLPLGIVLLCGMMTATFGGLTRDVLCQRPPRILHAHAGTYYFVYFNEYLGS